MTIFDCVNHDILLDKLIGSLWYCGWAMLILGLRAICVVASKQPSLRVASLLGVLFELGTTRINIAPLFCE